MAHKPAPAVYLFGPLFDSPVVVTNLPGVELIKYNYHVQYLNENYF